MLNRLCLLFAVAVFLTSCSDLGCENPMRETSYNGVFPDSMHISSQKVCQAALELGETVPFEDPVYPYAGIPQLFIETTCHYDILNKENYIAAKMRFYREGLADGDAVDLSLKGRGNSSWNDMPKHGFRILLDKKKPLLGMPENKDWVLIANYADKTLMKNFFTFQLATDIGVEYAPRSEFVELYLNGEYLGVYQLAEKITVGRNRVNLPKDKNSFLVEFDAKYQEGEQVIFSNVLAEDIPFRVHYPKDASDSSLSKLSDHIEAFEIFLKNVQDASLEEIEEWIDVEAYAKHFLIQEFSKNPDANFLTSVFFSWTEENVIKMGPVWDFDLAYGGYNLINSEVASSEGWRTKDEYWNGLLFSNKEFSRSVQAYWSRLQPIFKNSVEMIDSLREILELPAQNNFKRWNILREHGKWISNSVAKYDDAVNNFRKWVVGRRKWMDSNKL